MTTGGSQLISALYNEESKHLFTEFPLKYGITPLTQRRDIYIKPVNSVDDLFGNTVEFQLPKSCHFITKLQVQVKIEPLAARTTGPAATYAFKNRGLASYIKRITISYGNSFEWVISDHYLILKTIIDTEIFERKQSFLGFVGENAMTETLMAVSFHRDFFILMYRFVRDN